MRLEDRMEPHVKPDCSEYSVVQRAFNRFCDFLERVAMGAVNASTTSVRGGLEEGYAEIAEHEARMREKYAEAYAAANRKLRRRYFHLEAEVEEDSFAAVLRSCDGFVASVREQVPRSDRAAEFEDVLQSLGGRSLDGECAVHL